MVQQIQVGNEILEFPDNMSDTQIESILTEQFGGQQAPQPEADPSFLEKFGRAGIPRGGSGFAEFAGEIPVGLGKTAVGITQAVAELAGQGEFAQKLGEQLKKERETEGELSLAQRAGRATGETILPALASPRGLIKGGIVGGGLAGFTTPQEEGAMPERLTETAWGAGLGGAIGGTLAAGQAVGKGIKKLIKRVQTPEEILAKRLPEGQTADLLEQLKTADPDSPVILPDIAGDEVKGLTGTLGRLGGSKDIVREALEGRSFKAVERIKNQLSKDISDVGTYFGNLDDIAKARGGVASEFYEKAFKRNPTINLKKSDPTLLEKIQPEIRTVRRKFRLSEQEAPDNSLILLDKVKKSLWDSAETLKRKGAKEQAKVLDKLRTNLTQRLRKADKDYSEALDVFAGHSELIDAQKEGLIFSKSRPEELRKIIKNLSVGERDAYRIGVRESLDKTVSKTGVGADPAKRIFGNSEIRNQLKAVFPTEKKFRVFKKRMKEEIEAAKTKFKVLGNSATRERQVDDAQFLAANIARAATGVALKSPVTIVGAMTASIRNLFGGITDKNAKLLAKSLVNRKEGIEALENILKKEKNAAQKRLIGEAIQRLRPVVAATATIQQTIGE